MAGIWLSSSVFLSGGALEILKDGVSISSAATNIDFYGATDVTIDGDGVDVILSGAPPAWNISSFTNSVNQMENGDSITPVNFNWSFNNGDSDPTANQSVTPGSATILPTVRAYSYIPAITTTTTFTLQATQGATTRTRNTSITFMNRKYWGSDASATIGNIPFNNTDIPTFSDELTTNRTKTVTYDCSGGQYFYYIYPASMGLATFKVNSLPLTMVLNVANFTNQHGYMESYNVYRSEYIQYGNNIILEVL